MQNTDYRTSMLTKTKAAARKKAASPPAPKAEKPVKQVGAVVAAVKIMRFLASAGGPVNVSQVSKELKLNVSTTFNILRTLANLGVVDFNSSTKTYSLAIGALDLVKGLLGRGDSTLMVRSMMERVANDTDLTVQLWRPTGERMMLVMRAESNAPCRIHLSVGHTFPIFVGAMGRIMAAYSTLPKGDLRRRFEALRWAEPIDFATYMTQVETAREAGWAVDRGTLMSGTTTVSAPVTDAAGNVLMVCSGTTFSGLQDNAGIKAIAQEIKALANALSAMNVKP